MSKMNQQPAQGELDSLQKRLGYSFTDISLLEQALDMSKVSAAEGRVYDRLEKIGDRLLYPITLHLIESTYPEAPLCEVTRMERILTTNQNLAHLAIRLDLISVMVKRNPGFIFIEKTMADLFEAISAAIAKDAGDGNYLEGIARLSKVCKHLFAVDLALAQIDNPFPMLANEAIRRWKATLRHDWISIKYQRQPVGYTCKIHLPKKAARIFALQNRSRPFIAGTGVTTEQALRKAAGLALIKLLPERFPNSLGELSSFSWRIKEKK